MVTRIQILSKDQQEIHGKEITVTTYVCNGVWYLSMLSCKEFFFLFYLFNSQIHVHEDLGYGVYRKLLQAYQISPVLKVFNLLLTPLR